MKIGILTGGGDIPGLSPCVKAVGKGFTNHPVRGSGFVCHTASTKKTPRKSHQTSLLETSKTPAKHGFVSGAEGI